MSDPNPMFLAGERLPAGKAQALGSGGTSYTSSIDGSVTDPTYGTGAASGVWFRDGSLCKAFVSITFGVGTTAGSGSYSLPLPVDMLDVGLAQLMVGQGWGFDTSAATLYDVHLQWISGDPVNRARMLHSPSVGITAAAPFAPASGDTYILELEYPGDW